MVVKDKTWAGSLLEEETKKVTWTRWTATSTTPLIKSTEVIEEAPIEEVQIEETAPLQRPTIEWAEPLIKSTEVVEPAPIEEEVPVVEPTVTPKPSVKRTKVAAEEVPVMEKPTPIESAEDIKSKQLDIQAKEDDQITKDQEKTINSFTLAVQSGNLEEARDLAIKNPDLRGVFNSSIRATLWNKSNVEFFSKFNWASNDEMKSAAESGDLVVWSKQYNLLPEEQRRRFEQFNKLNASKRTDFASDNANIISLTDLWEKSQWLPSFDLRAKIEEARNNPELLQTRTDLESLQNEINEFDDALESLEDDIIDTNPKLPRSAILALVSRQSKDIIRNKNTKVNQYNAKLGTYKDLKSDIDMELKILQFESSQEKEIYKTNLAIFEKRRGEMREDEKLEFLAENKKIAADNQLIRQKELAEFNSSLRENNNTWGKYIDNGKWDIIYVKDWREVSVLTWLWKSVWTSEDDNYSYQIKTNEDGTHTVFWLPKKGQNIFQQTFGATWEESTSWIKWVWQGNITSYWWSHDRFEWLDIDGNIWDPVSLPIWGKVKTMVNHPLYWRTMIISTEDWWEIRFSHMDEFFIKVWETLTKWSIIWTIGNTGNVLKLDWNKPSAAELKAWFGSHLDIVSKDSDGKTRSAKQTEEYLNNLGIEKKEVSDKLSRDQQIFFNQQQTKFKSDPQVKAFESALASGWDLIRSLDSVSWPWDVAAIFQFMKTLDPASVVRESEFAVAANTAWVTAKPWLLLWRISEGLLLNDIQRKEFWRLAFEFIKNKGKLYDIKYDDMARVLANSDIWWTNLPTRITDLIWDFKTNDIKEISWNKTYTSNTWFQWDSTWIKDTQNSFFK